jgi:signal transduction histidine kinase
MRRRHCGDVRPGLGGGSKLGRSGALPGEGPTGRTELLHECQWTRVTRLFLNRCTVVCKEPLGSDAVRRLRHERDMLERLRGAPGIVQLVETSGYPDSIVLADVGGTSLAELAKPTAATVVIEFGVGLARAVAAMHRRGVMHGDITPANVLLARDGALVLVDFALATPLAEIRPEFRPVVPHGSEIAGTLAYLAPEQTGRTGRPVDERADLYALGATLYELATGAPPFGSDDPLRLTYDLLARVPVPAAKKNPQIPTPLSEIIMRLLDKEPDNRYQSADGLVHDLEQVRDARTDPAAGPVRLGEHDVPLRLLPPRLVGRDAEVATLQVAFEDSLVGRCRAVLVGGAPGVGKTALVDELRPVVTRGGGWFVAGKFDQYRRDVTSSGVHQAFRALGRLLLSEPEDELTAVRERILAEIGPNAGLMAAVVPEFAALLNVPPDPGDPLTAQVRGQRNGVQILRAVASRERPVVMFFDDIQWAGPTPLGFLDIVLDEEPVEGLLLVSAQREPVVDGADSLKARLSRWRNQAGVQYLRLDDLPVPSLVTMVADMLHVPPATAAGLARQLHLHTTGNPYESVELLGALRREGLLTATAAGWQWDTAAVRAHLGRSEVGELLAARVAATPPGTRRVMEAMASLSGRVEMSVLAAATGQPADVLEQTLEPALVEGVLVAEPGLHEAVRFRHDRIREAIRRGITPARRQTLHLAMARRLAAKPDLFAMAAEQYLPVSDTPDLLDDPAERRRVVELLRRAADQARSAGDHEMMSNLLGAAPKLIDPAEITVLVEVHTGRQVALFSLGRLEEADEEYRTIKSLRPTALLAAEATAMQVRSLTHRTRFVEAIELGLESLRDYGISVPPADQRPAELDHGFDRLYRWLDHTDASDDLARAELSEPTLLAATRLIDAVLPAAYFVSDPDLIAWLGLEALRIWIEHGPGPTLVGPAGHAAYHAGPQRGAYAAGYRALRRIVAVGEARGFEPGTSQARHMLAALIGWFEPIENGVREAQRAREGLITRGDLAYAGYTYQLSVPYLVDCAPSLETFVAEVDAGLAFLRRTGNEQTVEWLDSYRWLAEVLRGDGRAGARDPFATFQYADNPLPLLYAHLCHAIAAIVFSDQVGLAQHSAAAMPLLPAAVGFFSTSTVRLLHGLALAEQARGADGAERAALLVELDAMASWLTARSTEAPDNFLHLLRLLDAERAWAVGDFRAAAQAFDAARREVAHQQRPWHRALTAERAARFHLAHGLEQAGRDLLAQARHDYAAWGATAKVAQLDWAYPTLRPGPLTTPEAGVDRRGDDLRLSATVTTGTLDLLGILSASHALSSETSTERLHARVVEVLSAMTGATGVHMLLWNDDRRDWLLPTPGPDAADGPDPEHDLPRSVLRYVQRTGATLIVNDATRDDRFARDPYLAGLDRCSLLAMPILSRGSLQAVLLLENRLLRAAFSSERLDAVKLIAAQLAVSLDNAHLYTDLTASRARIAAAADHARRQIERDLHDGAQQRLVTLALRARTARAAVPPGSGRLVEELDALATEATTAMTELRELARGIHPSTLTKGGILPALNALARRSPVPVQIKALTDQRLSEPIETAAYYVVAEALTNATKHADASTVTVMVEIDTIPAGAVLKVQVHDDGRGGALFTGGSGLLGLKDRVETLGGRLAVHSAPGTGTTVQAEFPLYRVDAITG